MEKFTFFWKGPLSQWHPSPFTFDGIQYGCAEQFMMAAKAELFGDEEMRQKIMATNSPRQQKALGRKVRGFNQEVWDGEAYHIVFEGNYRKFTQNPDLCEILLATAGTTLVETNPHDKIWGIGLREGDPRTLHREMWQGENRLGEVLMGVRDAIVDDPQSAFMRTFLARWKRNDPALYTLWDFSYNV